ncbi:MAG: YbgC/FadM family acyl-CoA thioesterase [Candidatus Omnitrophica bacterium]|nr:YbgC/FadM family acyl-CoA thioesterase [Candidatus Omnitrophota bacterium]
MQRQVFYHDTDAGGVVYYANYLKYLEEARTEFFEARGIGVADLLARGLFYAVRSCNILYKSPARYGDTVVADASIKTLTGAQIIFSQSVVERATARILVEATVALVCLDKDFKPQPIPADIKEKIK